MSFNNGYSVSPISASNILNFSTDIAAIVEQVNNAEGVGLKTVAVVGPNLNGNGQVANPIFLSDQITVTDVHTNNLSASGNAILSSVSITTNLSSSKVTASFSGDGSGITNISTTNISNFTTDTRAQFSAGNNIDITNGVISTTGVPTRTEITGALTSYATLTGVSGTFTTPSQVTGAFAVVTAANATNSVNAQTASYVATASAIPTFKSDVQAQLSAGANLSYATGTFALNDAISLSSVTASLKGNGSQVTNITASNIPNFTTDTRAQFSAGTNISIASGVVSTVNVPTNAEITGALGSYATLSGVTGAIANFPTRTEVTGVLGNYATLSGVSGTFTTPAQVTSALTPYATLTGVSGTFTTPAQVTASFNTVTAKNALTASYIATGSAIATFTTDVRNQLSANNNISYNAGTGQFTLNANVNTTSVTASFSGNGSQVTNITASNIPNFTADVRNQISGSQYVSYNSSTGVVSLPFTGSLIGTTPIILGQTASVLTGLTAITASNINSSFITASTLVANTFVTGSQALGANLQILTGSNRPAGTVVLNGKTTVTVTNSLVTANSLIFITKQTFGTVNGQVGITTKGAGTFGVQSNTGGDNDTIAYLIINPI